MELDPSRIDPKHLKISFPKGRDGMSRRDLLFGLLKPQYEIVPAVEEDRCVAWRGCSLCVASCPQEAISLQGGSASIDKDQCTACGACLPSCPVGAISSPLLNPELLDASLRSLLRRDGNDLGSRVLLLTTGDAEPSVISVRESLASQSAELKLPCIAALSPWLLLRCFDLGADGIAIVPCGPTCRRRCREEGWQRTMRFVQALLGKLGIEQERVQVFLFSREEPQSLARQLSAFVERVKGMVPTALRSGGEKEERLTLAVLLKYFGQRLKLHESHLSGDELPFGLVTVEAGDKACTLCGACPDRCLTGAITLQEGADSSQLLFDHSRCVACEACVRVCPEQVLALERALDFSRLTETTVLAEDRMAHCRNCGKDIAPLKMLRRIQQQMAASGHGSSTSLAQYCPDCRIFGRLGLKQDRPGWR